MLPSLIVSKLANPQSETHVQFSHPDYMSCRKYSPPRRKKLLSPQKNSGHTQIWLNKSKKKQQTEKWTERKKIPETKNTKKKSLGSHCRKPNSIIVDASLQEFSQKIKIQKYRLRSRNSEKKRWRNRARNWLTEKGYCNIPYYG